MASIVFFILHEVGSINASFRLARDLELRGHDVTYLGLADSEEMVTASGFNFVLLFERHFPKGSIQVLTNQGTFRQGLQYLSWLPRKNRLFHRFVDYLLDGGDDEFFRAADTLQPDLILFSGGPYIEWPALMAFSRGIKSAYFCSTLSPRSGTGLPPMTSAIIPRFQNSWWRAIHIWLAWRKVHFLRMLHFIGHGRLTRRLAMKYGITDYRQETVYPRGMSVTLPEIIPFPPDFDFPSPRLPDQHYIGASICLDRREQEFPWERLDPGKPLAYCALGTYLWYPAKRYHRFFNAVLEAARLMPDWQWVLATGGSLSPNDVGSVPTNVSIVRNAPQIGLLKRAQIMVTHGGANTVKECVLLGVPMVIFPLGGDHPGIAARAIYHGLAVQGEFTRINGMKLKSLVYAAINNAYLRTQVNLMQSRFVDMEEAKAGVKLVESLLPSYGRP